MHFRAETNTNNLIQQTLKHKKRKQQTGTKIAKSALHTKNIHQSTEQRRYITMTVNRINSQKLDLTLLHVIKSLSGLYREERHPTQIHTSCQGRAVDVFVHTEKTPIYFKVLTSYPSNIRPFQSEWKRLDSLGEEWWLCVPDEELEQFETLLKGRSLYHVNLCTWTWVNSNDIGFFELPEID